MADLQKLKKDIQQFQIEHFPELFNSVVNHGKKEKSLLTEKEYQYKLRTGRETNKEQIMGMLKTCCKKAASKETFLALLKEYGLKTYDRSGKTTGVVLNNQKFRFSRLGFTEERFEGLGRMQKRNRELSESRNKGKEKSFELNLEK